MPHLLHPYKLVMGGDIAPVVQSNFALSANDFDSLSSTSTMPTGGSISRAGNAMLYDSTGKLTYAPNNLLLYSQDITNAAWNASTVGVTRNDAAGTAPDGTNTACLLQETTAATSWHFILQTSLTPAAGVKYLYSVYVKYAGTRYAYIQYGAFGGMTTDGGIDFNTNTAVGSATVTPVGSGWYRVTVPTTTASAAAGGVYIGVSTTWPVTQYTGSTSNGVLVWGAQLEAVTYQTTPSTYVATTTSAYYGPRFDYDPVTLQPKGLLVEGTRTNLYFPSTNVNGFTSVFRTAFGVPTANAAVAPDGSSTADQIMETATTNNFVLQLAKSQPTGQYTFSIHVKGINKSWVRIAFYDSSVAGGAFFNIPSNGSGFSVGTQNNATGAMSYVGNGWYRLSITFQNTLGTQIYCQIYGAVSNGNDYYAGNTSNGYYIWGWQLEQAPFASSYIPTVTNATARAAETFSLTGYANRLVEAYYIDEETGGSYSGNSALSTGTVTISPPTFGWVTSLRAYTNAYAGSISSPSWLSFSRAGNAMMTDSTGTLTWAPANLIPQSQDFATTWTRGNVSSPTVFISAPDNSNTGAKLAASNTGLVVHQVYNIGVALSAGTYIASVYLKKDAYSYGIVNFYDGIDNYCYFNLDNGVPGTAAAGVTTGMQSVGNGWYRCWARKTISAVTGGMSIEFSNADNTPASSAAIGSGVYAWGAQLERVTYQTAPSAYIPTTSAAVYGPRYDYDPSTVPATPRGLLIEESRQNLVAASQAVSTWGVWLSGVTATGNTGATTAPDGTNTATLLVPTANPAQFARPATGASGNYIVSIYAKATDATNCWIGVYDFSAGAIRAYFNVNAGTLGTVSSGYTGTITSVGNGWYRISFTQTTAVSNPSFYANIYSGNGGTAPVSNGVSGVYLWGAQLEAGSFATSYIPTTSASVTRAADVAQLTGSALTTLLSSQASIAVEAQTVTTSKANAVYAVSDNTINNFYNFYTQSGAGYFQIFSGGSNQGTMAASGTISANTTFRIAEAIKASNYASVLNGGTVGVNNTAPIPSGMNRAYLGDNFASGNSLNGVVRSVAIYNQRLPDAILKQKSAINAPY